MEPRVSYLTNKLKIVLMPMPWLHSVTVVMYIKAGSRYESKEQIGAAHFLEHLTLRGTKNYPTKLAIARILDKMGGKTKAGTGKEVALYQFKIPQGKENLLSILEVLREVLFHPLIRPQDVEIERKVILQEMDRRKDAPTKFIYDLLDNITWPSSPLGRPVIGTPESVKKLKRKDLLDFQQTRYQPQNMVLGLAGNFQRIDIDSIIRDYFLQYENHFGKTEVENSAIEEEQISPRMRIVKQSTQQTHLAFLFRAFSYNHPDEFKAKLLATILGGGFSSRLFQKLREEKGLAYKVNAFFEGFCNTGAIGIYTGVDNQKLKEAITVILAEVKKLKDSLIDKSELSQAKQKVKGRLALNLEAPGHILAWYVPQVLLKKKVLSYDDFCQELKQITAHDIQKIAQAVFKNKNLNLGIIGKVESEGDLINLLNVE